MNPSGVRNIGDSFIRFISEGAGPWMDMLEPWRIIFGLFLFSVLMAISVLAFFFTVFQLLWWRPPSERSRKLGSNGGT